MERKVSYGCLSTVTRTPSSAFHEAAIWSAAAALNALSELTSRQMDSTVSVSLSVPSS